MGAWEKLIHPVARRAYFVNRDTGQTCWTTPAEVCVCVYVMFVCMRVCVKCLAYELSVVLLSYCYCCGGYGCML